MTAGQDLGLNFDKSFDKLFDHEGGYVNDPRDPGGETKFGISKRSYPQEDIRNLSRERAKELYYRDFWEPIAAMNINAQLRFHVFDTAVNSGIGTAVRLLQQMCGMPPEMQDGRYGPFTARALRQVPDDKAVEWYNGWRLLYYCDLHTFETFGKGWVRRTARNLLLR